MSWAAAAAARSRETGGLQLPEERHSPESELIDLERARNETERFFPEARALGMTLVDADCVSGFDLGSAVDGWAPLAARTRPFRLLQHCRFGGGRLRGVSDGVLQRPSDRQKSLASRSSTYDTESLFSTTPRIFGEDGGEASSDRGRRPGA